MRKKMLGGVSMVTTYSRGDECGYSHPNNGNSENGLLHLTSLAEVGQGSDVIGVVVGDIRVGVTRAKDGPDVRFARVGSGAAIGRSDVDEAGDEADIQSDGDERCEGVAGDAAEQEKAQESVQYCRTRDAFHGPDPVVDEDVVVGHDGQEVGEEGEDNGGAAELYAADEPLKELQGQT